MLDESTKGIFTITATPFLPDGALDFHSLEQMVNVYIEKGATGLTILGMMGEAEKLSSQESIEVIKTVTKNCNVPVIVGVSAPGFSAMTMVSDASMEAGATGVMVAPPSRLRTDAQITSYYQSTSEALGQIPFVLQDFPLATGVIISTSVILKIVEDCANCVMLKHEDWPGLEKITQLRQASDAGARRISILCGNGGMYLLEELLRGADGAMTGFGYPEMMSQVMNAFNKGNLDQARDIFDAYLPMIRYEAQPGMGLAIRKYSLVKQGVIAHPTLRKPGPLLTKDTINEIDSLAQRQEKRLDQLGL